MKIEHRKGKDNIVPDALSRSFSSEELIEELDGVDNDCINDTEYQKLVNKVRSKREESNLIVKGNRVFIKSNRDNLYRFYVPKAMIEKLLRENHDDPRAGHLGIEKTYERLSRLYFWSRMYETVRQYVNKCHPCKASKPPNYCLRPPMSNFKTTTVPWERLYVDFIGPCPRSKLGHSYALIMIDHFSKFTLIGNLRAATSDLAIDTLKKRVFNLFGVPETIVTDNGSQFTSHKFENFISKFGIKHIFTPKHSPQANSAERPNRTILGAIRSYITDDHRDWDQYLDEIGCAIRTSIHDAIGYSTFYALFGRHMVSSGTKYGLLRELNCLDDSDVDIIDQKTHFQKLRDDIMIHLKLASEQYSHKYNLRSKNRSFLVNQNVYVRNFVLSDSSKRFSAKLAPKFIKARIIEKIGTVAYKCVDDKGNPLGVYHGKDILN